MALDDFIPKREAFLQILNAEQAKIAALMEQREKQISEIEIPEWLPPSMTRQPTISMEQFQPMISPMEPTTQPEFMQTLMVPQRVQPTTLPISTEIPDGLGEIQARPDVEWWEEPKMLTERLMAGVGKGVSKIPLVREAFEFVSPAFEWIHEELEKPWAAAITAPLSPDIPWKSGESWIDHEKREYAEWKAPTYVKGLAEFAMPLWWMPFLGWASKGAKSLVGVGKAGKMAAALPKLAHEAIMPTYTQLEKFIPNNLFKKVALKYEHTPVLGRMIKAAGGESAFTRRNPLTDVDKAKNFAVFQGIQRDMGRNIVNVKMNELAVKKFVGEVMKDKTLV